MPLRDGRIVLAGGEKPALWDPASGRWKPLPSFADKRRGLLTPLSDGRVLRTGGSKPMGDYFRAGIGAALVREGAAAGDAADTSEIWDPARERWHSAGRLHEARWQQTATELLDGRVLVAGGAHREWRKWNTIGAGTVADAQEIATGTTELWDPRKGNWTPGPHLLTTRRNHAAVRLIDGRVLVLGGTRFPQASGQTPLADAELFDPRTSAWVATAPMKRPRIAPAAALLKDGRVLVVGPGVDVEIWSPTTGQWSPGPPLGVPRDRPHIAMLTDGSVIDVSEDLTTCQARAAAAEVLDPAAKSWRLTAAFNIKRCDPFVAPLPDGRALIGGGVVDSKNVGRAVEIWAP